MAVTKLLTYDNLSTYDSLIKSVIATGDAKAIKTVLWDSTAEQIKFFKKENATLADTADYAVSISSSDVSNLQTRVGMSSTLNTYESATNLTDILNILTGSSSTTGSVAKALADAEGYTDTKIAALDADLDASGTAQHSGTFVVSGVTEVDGVLTAVDSVEVEAAGAAAALDATLAAVAKSGDADDVAYDNTTSGLTATDVQAAIDEVAAASAGGVGSKTVYITETSGSSSDPFSKKYGIYQGATGSSSSPVAGEKLAEIDVPKDMVVEDGAVVDVVFVSADSSLHEGSASGTDVTAEIVGTGTATASDAGKYIKLTIANAASSHLWIKATDLVDIYTAEQNATQVQLVIDSNNEISATIVAGSITATELDTDAVTTIKIADDAVTADKVAISAHTESQTAGADGVAISVTTTDGQVSSVSASIAANTYEPYGAASTAIAALDATETQTAGTDGLALSITEVDGVITGISGSIASGTYLDTASYQMAESSDISALFPVT